VPNPFGGALTGLTTNEGAVNIFCELTFRGGKFSVEEGGKPLDRRELLDIYIVLSLRFLSR
jgi:hypothetical protein